MNLQHVVMRSLDDTDPDCDTRDTMLYALSLGLGSDSLDDDELPCVYEGLPGRQGDGGGDHGQPSFDLAAVCWRSF